MIILKNKRFENRKQAKEELGISIYNKLLKKGLFIFQ